MNKQDLIEKLLTKTKHPVSKADMERIVVGFMDEIKNAVAAGEDVNLVGFGTFKVRNKAAREAYDPINHKKIHVPAKKAPAFKAGKAFKDVVNK